MTATLYDVAALKNRARGGWVNLLSRFGVDAALLTNRHGPCPGCGGKDRFRFDDQEGNGTFICSQGGAGNLAGDGLALLMHVKGWEWQRCVQEIAEALGLEPKKAGHKGPSHTAYDWNQGVAAEPKLDRKKIPAIDRDKVEEFVRGCPEVDDGFLRRRSPIAISNRTDGTDRTDKSCASAKEFLFHLYEPGERILVFTQQWSQGDFLAEIQGKKSDHEHDHEHEHDVATYRLAMERGVKARRSELPKGGKEGVWFLTNPVSGQWDINPHGKDGPTWSRRFQKVVTAWRYYVLESDVLPAALWRKVVVSLPLPIAAIYTSGSRSIHALVREPVDSKSQWDAVRDALRQIVCPLGADAGALSAVRLSRLPFCERAGTRGKDNRYIKFPESATADLSRGKPGYQELLYLNPDPEHSAIRLLPERRG
jgi:Zinc-binding domain of primase-helicase